MSELPAGWAWATLEDISAVEPRSITDGPFGSNLKSSHYVDAGPRVIRLQNVGFGEFIDERAHITEEHFDKLRAHAVQADDLVVASLGQDLPRNCVIPDDVGPAIVKADCIRVRLHKEIDVHFVNYALQRPDLRHAVADQIHGVGRPRLGMTGIRALPIPIPPRAEQERIVSAIDEYFSHLDFVARQLRRVAVPLGYDLTANPGRGSLRKSVLSAAAAGRLVPQDPSEEPASSLLDRIRAERAQAPFARRKRGTKAS